LLGPTVCPPIVDGDVLALDVTQFAESLAERIQKVPVRGQGARLDEPDARDLSGLLALGDERRGEGDKHPSDERAPVHY
jgi:hypothetical protein